MGKLSITPVSATPIKSEANNEKATNKEGFKDGKSF